MENFIVVEVGSTVTKAYHYLEGETVVLPSQTIRFRTHLKDGKLNNDDINDLIKFVVALKEKTENVFVYGTSIFRNIDEKEFKRFLTVFKKQTSIKEFNVVSAEQEALYTVSGVTLGNDYTGRLAVMIGGGGSVEVMIIENKKIIEKHFNNFGAISVNEKIKDINAYKPKASLIKQINSICDAGIANIENKADILVTSGGDTKYCQECMASKYLMQNKFYKDKLQPHMIKVSDFIKANNDFILNQDINVFKNFVVYQDAWWDGARAFNSTIIAVAKKVGAKYEIPSRINMCNGIINELKNNN